MSTQNYRVAITSIYPDEPCSDFTNVRSAQVEDGFLVLDFGRSHSISFKRDYIRYYEVQDLSDRESSTPPVSGRASDE